MLDHPTFGAFYLKSPVTTSPSPSGTLTVLSYNTHAIMISVYTIHCSKGPHDEAHTYLVFSCSPVSLDLASGPQVSLLRLILTYISSISSVFPVNAESPLNLSL